jgi:1-acyl-sn-glycerol-3-phosphate acyltransferase
LKEDNKYNKPLLVLRSALYWVWCIFLTLLFAIPVLLSALFSTELGFRFAHIWLRLNLSGLRLICGLRWKVEGRENIPSTPCLVLSKHQSTWETFFLPTLVPKSVYVAKRSLALIPIFGWALFALKMILINRKSGSSAVNQIINQSIERMANGYSVVIFPEGTRMPVGADTNYRIGGAAVAEKTGADILPVALNSGEFWPRMGFIKWPGEITVCVGPLISSQGKSATALLTETEQWIETKMKEISVPGRFPY